MNRKESKKRRTWKKKKESNRSEQTKTIFGFWFPQWRSSTAISSCCCCLGWGKAHSLKFNDWKVRCCCCSHCCCGCIEMHQAATLRYPLDYWLWNSSRWPGTARRGKRANMQQPQTQQQQQQRQRRRRRSAINLQIPVAVLSSVARNKFS